MPFFQIIPTSSSRTESKRLFYTSVSLLLSRIQGYCSVQFSSVTQSCPTLRDPMNHSTPSLPVHHQLPEFTQTHIHRVSDAIQPSHPSGSSQCISPEYPVSCIEPGLVIRFIYDIVHVSMPFSQIIPPSPSSTESKSPFYTSVSLLLSRIQGHHYHFSKFHIYVLCFSFWLTSLYIIGSSFIHLIRTDSILRNIST